METLFIGKNFVVLPELGSTNTEAEKLLLEAPPEGTVVYTPYQTQGKGQHQAKWYSAPGLNLTFSLILYPKFLPPRKVFQISQMISVALREVVAELCPEKDVWIKWPNDILVENKKVAGILINNHIDRVAVKSSIIGIGLNLNQQEFPEADYGKASSILNETGKQQVPEVVLEQVLKQIESSYLKLRQSSTDGIEQKYLKYLWKYQEPVEAIIDGKAQATMIIGVDKDGKISVELDGKLASFNMKEIEFLR